MGASLHLKKFATPSTARSPPKVPLLTIMPQVCLGGKVTVRTTEPKGVPTYCKMCQSIQLTRKWAAGAQGAAVGSTLHASVPGCPESLSITAAGPDSLVLTTHHCLSPLLPLAAQCEVYDRDSGRIQTGRSAVRCPPTKAYVGAAISASDLGCTATNSVVDAGAIDFVSPCASLQHKHMRGAMADSASVSLALLLAPTSLPGALRAL